VNSVHPGWVRTEMVNIGMSAIPVGEALLDQLRRLHSLDRFGDPGEIASAELTRQSRG